MAWPTFGPKFFVYLCVDDPIDYRHRPICAEWPMGHRRRPKCTRWPMGDSFGHGLWAIVLGMAYEATCSMQTGSRPAQMPLASFGFFDFIE